MKEYDSQGQNVIRQAELSDGKNIEIKKPRADGSFDVITTDNEWFEFTREKPLNDSTKLICDSIVWENENDFSYMDNIILNTNKEQFSKDFYFFIDGRLISYSKNALADKNNASAEEHYYFTFDKFNSYEKKLLTSFEKGYDKTIDRYVMKEGKLIKKED